MLVSTDAAAGHSIDLTAGGALDELAGRIAEHGLAMFTGLRDHDSLLTLTTGLGAAVPHRDSDPTGITVVTSRTAVCSRAGYSGFSDQELDPHTDRSGTPEPPLLMILACARPAPQGGECAVVDGQAVHTDLAATAPDALAALSAPRCALFGGAAGHLGSVFERLPAGRFGVRLRLDGLVRFSPQAQRWLPVLRQAIDRHTLVFALPAGAGYVVNNRRWLHARRRFIGHRVMWRVLVNPIPRWHIHAGYEPARSR